MDKKTIIFHNILFLCLLYSSIALFFALMYIILDILNLGYVRDHYNSLLHQKQPIDYITRSIYFSITTLFSVGYGDTSPFGLSKGVAVIESMIGYVLPYGIVLKYVLFNPKYPKKH